MSTRGSVTKIAAPRSGCGPADPVRHGYDLCPQPALPARNVHRLIQSRLGLRVVPIGCKSPTHFGPFSLREPVKGLPSGSLYGKKTVLRCPVFSFPHTVSPRAEGYRISSGVPRTAN